ncbi:MAG: LysM peptidoglycan-binding domain-containing protein [Myxococcota bacterium]|nr:LysM peptidoglycan-binding domain-containing protein [Myxococcota bacterium]
MSTTRPTRSTANVSLHLAVVIALVGALVGCREPTESRRRVKLKLDPNLVSHEWKEGPRRDAIIALVERRARAFARSIFAGDPMPSGMPSELEDETTREMLASIASSHSGGVEEPPTWWKGVAAQPQSYKHDLPKEYLIKVQRGETYASLARWSKSEPARIKALNRERMKGTRYLRPGMQLKLTMSPHQKMVFDQARERFQQKRLEDYFSERYIERVISYVVQRGDVIAKVAAQYGEVPIWLLEEFNKTDFRSLQPGDTILIPTVKRMRGGRRAPPRLQVVDKHGRSLTAARRDALGEKLRPDLLGQARLAMDDSNVFERDARATARATDGALLPQSNLVPAVIMAPSPGASVVPGTPTVAAPKGATRASPRVAHREVIVKPGETLSHYASWSGLTVDGILNANAGLEPELLFAGRRIRLPLSDLAYADFVLARAGTRRPGKDAAAATKKDSASTKTTASATTYDSHVVASGETATAIAKKLGVKLSDLKKANPGRNLDLLYVGGRIRVPKKAKH